MHVQPSRQSSLSKASAKMARQRTCLKACPSCWLRSVEPSMSVHTKARSRSHTPAAILLSMCCTATGPLLSWLLASLTGCDDRANMRAFSCLASCKHSNRGVGSQAVQRRLDCRPSLCTAQRACTVMSSSNHTVLALLASQAHLSLLLFPLPVLAHSVLHDVNSSHSTNCQAANAAHRSNQSGVLC